jgi:hypothetical protein
MAAVELDRQTIERRDFPINRRGYDPAAVDAHLRAVAVAVEDLRRSFAAGAADASLASSAGSHVQAIVEAAEAAAAEIERHAVENARQVREAADRDAQHTREDAIQRSRADIAGVSQVAATLLERVGGMDAEVHALLESLRAGAGRLANDLAAVDGSINQLYHAAAGAGSADAGAPGAEPGEPPFAAAPAPPPSAEAFEAELAGAIAAHRVPAQEPFEAPPAPPPEPVQATEAASTEDLDGARLIALNMALNGEPRDATERYLAENFQLSDRAKLIDEVYAAIDG